MSQILQIQAETRDLFAALDRYVEVAERHTRAAARETSEHLVRGARARARRGKTGRLQEGIRLADDYTRVGYVVTSTRDPQPNVPIWQQFGTRYAVAHPYFYQEVEIERLPHAERVRDALRDAAEEVGLGD